MGSAVDGIEFCFCLFCRKVVHFLYRRGAYSFALFFSFKIVIRRDMKQLGAESFFIGGDWITHATMPPRRGGAQTNPSAGR